MLFLLNFMVNHCHQTLTSHFLITPHHHNAILNGEFYFHMQCVWHVSHGMYLRPCQDCRVWGNHIHNYEIHYHLFPL